MSKKRPSSLWPRTLRSQLTLLLLIFWLLPVTGLGAYTMLVYRQNVADNLRSTMDSRLYYAALLTNEKLSAAVAASRDISYDPTLEQLVREYNNASAHSSSAQGRYQQQYQAGQDLKNVCTGYLNNQFALNNDFSLAVLLLDIQPGTSYYTTVSSQTAYDYYATFVARSAQKMSDSLGNKVGFIAYNEHLYLVRRLRTMDNTAYLGTLVLELNTDSVFQFLLDAVGRDTSFFIQLNDAPLTLQSPSYEYLEPPVLSASDSGIREEFGFVTFSGWFSGRDYSLGYQVPVPDSALYGSFTSLNQLLILIALVSIVFILFLYRVFRNRFTRPLESLSSAAWALRNGELGVHAKAPRDDEVGELVQSFNAMSDQMLTLFNRIYREQLALKDARIIALQSQINPHFFNNTLELMNWKARMLGDEQLSDMIQALSTLLDSAMDRRNTRYVPLRNELAVADAYLTIITARFGRRLQLKKNIDESRLDTLVPRMILQPLLENAVVHGLEPVGGGLLLLQVTGRGSMLDISIINDGKPLTDEDFTHIDELLSKPIDPSDPRSHHLGIRNVHERLQLIYGDKSGLHFRMDEENRTHCYFQVPPPQPGKEQEEIQ